MKSYIGLLLLLLIAYSKSDSDCEKIKPEKASDCVLSEKDKKTYKYCCLEKLAGTLYCDAYNQDMIMKFKKQHMTPFMIQN